MSHIFEFLGFPEGTPIPEGTEHEVLIAGAGRQVKGKPFAVLEHIAAELRKSPLFKEITPKAEKPEDEKPAEMAGNEAPEKPAADSAAVEKPAKPPRASASSTK